MDGAFVARVAARLPEDIGLLCDFRERPWPKSWVQNFWRYNFFYVSGLQQYLAELKIIDNDNELQNLFSELATTVHQLINNTWLVELFEVHPDDMDIEATMQAQNLQTLNMDRLSMASRNEPVAFSQALLTTVALAARMELDGDDREICEVAQIRCAAHYLPDFGVIYDHLEPSERISLREETLQPSPRLFEDIAAGFPITHSLALDIEHCLVNNSEIGPALTRLPISTHQSRRSINRIVRSHGRNTGTGGNMRTASPEQTYRRKPNSN